MALAGPGSAAGQTPQLLCPGLGLGLGTGKNPEEPKLLPTCVPQVGVGRAEKLQNSLELRKTGPSCGAAPGLSAAPGSLAGGPGGVRRRPAAHTGLAQAAAVSEREQV